MMYDLRSHSRVGDRRKPRLAQGRRLVVVDIENVVGGAVTQVAQAELAKMLIDQAVTLRPGEHVVIGTSHIGMLATGLGWRGSRLVVRSGQNGADLALLEVLQDERVDQRFEEVVVVSGDGVFSEAVAALAAAGVRVTVVSRQQACAARLRSAAAETIYLPHITEGLGGAA